MGRQILLSRDCRLALPLQHWLTAHEKNTWPAHSSMDTYLLLGRKAMANLDSELKSKDVTLPTKVNIVKAMVYPVVMYRWESWTVKKAEH